MDCLCRMNLYERISFFCFKTKFIFSMTAKSTYTGDQIVVLEGLRARTQASGHVHRIHLLSGVHHCLNEIIDNSIDEALAGYAKNDVGSIFMPTKASLYEIDGWGIPVDKNAKYGVTALELVMTKLHAGEKFEAKHIKSPEDCMVSAHL